MPQTIIRILLMGTGGYLIGGEIWASRGNPPLMGAWIGVILLVVAISRCLGELYDRDSS